MKGDIHFDLVMRNFTSEQVTASVWKDKLGHIFERRPAQVLNEFAGSVCVMRFRSVNI